MYVVSHTTPLDAVCVHSPVQSTGWPWHHERRLLALCLNGVSPHVGEPGRAWRSGAGLVTTDRLCREPIDSTVNFCR